MSFEERQAALLARHDEGAVSALRAAHVMETRGRAYLEREVLNVEETLIDLAEDGWLLTRAPEIGERTDG